MSVPPAGERRDPPLVGPPPGVTHHPDAGPHDPPAARERDDVCTHWCMTGA